MDSKKFQKIKIEDELLIDEKTPKRLSRKKKARELYRKDINYFDRVKKESRRSFSPVRRKSNRIYFDCETYQLYTDKNDPDELPIIVPYLIGACTEDTSSYAYFKGDNSAIEFFEWLWDRPESDDGLLCAFNIDYDFHSIRPFITDKYSNQIRMSYEMTDSKKFIFGDISNRNERRGRNKDKKMKVKLIDLWRWNTFLNLDKYIIHILKLTYDKEGNVKNDPISVKLDEKLKAWGFTRDSFKKLKIDPEKINLHQVGDKWFYYPTKEDWINKTNKKELDLEHELKYLKIDVTSLPIVSYEQDLMRDLACRTLGIIDPIDPDRAITIPGFTKWLWEEYDEKYMTETYRTKVSVDDYRLMCYSYTGAFVGGNSDITYLDENKFKELYPGQNFLDADGSPRIKSFDVNSMYPWAMSLGLPVGDVWNTKPSDDCVVWYEVHFSDFIDKETKTIYRWKKKYSCLNNSFFGDNFELSLYPGLHSTNKVYILKELYELFVSMCDAKCEVVAKRYQVRSKTIVPFVDKLYEIKRNEGKTKYPDSTVAMVKLMLNSLYGKMAEKFREKKVEWATDCDTFVLNNPELVEELDKMGVKVSEDEPTLTPELISKHRFKMKVSPFIDLKNDCGFFFVQSKEKRYDAEGNECRESITAGIFITSMSRYKLLSTVKGEIDQGNVVLYCDTDSIKMITFKPPKFKEHKSDLGAWKNEGSFYYFGHPNKLKKYFMHNPNEPKDSKTRWMVKTSGISEKHLKPKGEEYDLETIKTIYDPNNRILVKNSKPFNTRNMWYQTVIRKTDFKFVFECPKDKITHVMEDGVLKKVDG